MHPISKIDWSSKRVLLFDWDGTLMDTLSAWNMADVKLLETFCGTTCTPLEAHHSMLDFMKNHTGGGDPYLAHSAMLIKKHNIPNVTPEELSNWRGDVANESLLAMGYKEGAAEFLNAAKSRGLKLGVVTTTDQHQIDTYRFDNPFIAASAPIDSLFDIIITSDSVTRQKPHPEPYLTALYQFGGHPRDFLVFEDSLPGIESAKAAGLEVVHVFDEYATTHLPAINALADYRIKN